MKTLRRLLPLLSVVLLALALPGARAASNPPITVKFDHSTTGFDLDGAHRDLPCESCHLDAVFQGTPRDCAACHSRGTRFNATPKPATHVLSSDNCVACHTTTAYLPVVHFDHAEVRGSCASCHDGVHAVGKPAGHVPTTQPCESCHSTVAWQPAGFDHAGITGGCSSCHDGHTATGKGTNHIATSTSCEACHSTNYWQPALRVDHAQVSGSCFSCHSGAVAISTGTITGKSANHIPADNNCETCHVSTTAWSQVNFSHAGLTATCYTCHDGTHGSIQGKNDQHLPTTNACEDCHNTSTWKPTVTVDHAQVVGTCYSCHNGTTAISTGPVEFKQPDHISSSNNCENCHLTTAWKPASVSHDNVTGSCVSCHNGTTATGKTPTHMTTTDDCQACHNVVAWKPADRVDHAQVLGSCYSCHNGSLTISTGVVTQKNPTHIATSNSCDACHVTAAWKPASKVDHTQVTGTCTSCHSGTVAISTGFITGKPVNHVVTSDDCSTCHTTSAWKPANFNHANITGTCVSCHNGTNATGKNPTHLVTSDACDTCHNTVTWKPTTRVDHAQIPAAVAGGCISCHNGTLSISTGVVTAKPADAVHQNVTKECGACHTTTAWTPATFDHAGISTGCSGCHNGTTATGKNPTHLATSNSCESCHGTTTWKPATKVDHTQVTGTCVSCHSGTVTISTGTVAGKTPTHLATSNTCESCHGTTTWKPATRVDHTQVTGTCVSCHSGTVTISTGTVTGKTPTHLATSNSCESCHGTTTWKPATKVDHTQVSGSCVSCHSGTVTISTGTVTGKTPTHVVSDNNCQNCHTTDAWKPANFNHNNITGTCVSCHNGTNATGKNPTHIVTTDACDACHSTVVWKPTLRTDHTQIPAAVSGGCISCHNGTLTISTGVVTAKPADVVHQGVTKECGACHVTTAWTPASFDHGGITSGCSTCHNGTAATGKTPTHLATSNSCESCHNTVTWKPAISVDHTQVTGTCYSCHSGTVTISTGTVTGKTATHIASSNSCENCHTTAAWKPANVNHDNVTGTCQSCHNGTTATGKTPTHLATTDACGSCHNVVAWKPAVKVDHTQVSGSCVSCHSGTVTISTGTVTGKPANHPVTDNNCQNCHTTSAWLPANFDHNGITSNCYSCHNGTNATGKGAQHINSTTSCESCHGVVAWHPTVKVDHTQVNGTCTSCHNGTTPLGTPPTSSGTITGKPADVIHQNTTAQCSTCHTTAAWTPATYDHTGITTNCASCHNGTNATGKTPTHIASTNACETCHSTVTFKPATRVDHAQVTGTCVSCHSGTLVISTGTVAGKNASHMPTSNLCTNCHTTTAWKPARTFDHTQASVTTCVSCHSGSVLISTGYVTGKNATHIATNNSCENCHTTNAWKPAGFDHTGVQPGTCSTCHNNVQATGKPNGHIATTAECDSCHTTTAWTPIHFNHTGVTSGCSACHDGNVATGKPTGHFVTVRECIECHNTTAWTPVTHVHVSVNYPGNHRTALDCTNSACHGGNSETATWRSPTYANSCAGCHQSDYRTDPHTKYGNTKYTVSELRNCSGACHTYTDATLTTISRRRNGPQHRVTDGSFN